MTRWMACAALLAVLALGVRAEDEKKDTKSKAAEALSQLEENYIGKIRAEKDAEKRQELFEEFAGKLLEHAKANAKDASAPQALVMVLGATKPGKSKTRDAALATFEKEYVKGKIEGGLLRRLAGSGTDAEALGLVKKIYKDNPDKMTRALAAKALLSAYDRLPKIAANLEKNEKMRENAEKQLGKETIEKLLTDAKEAPKLVKEYRKALKEEFKGLLPDLSVGATAPESVSVLLDGKQAKLSDLKGKVVVLDFWATWCGPCVKMIPHNRELVKKLADKPFVLVSISADEKKETLESFMKKTPMPWTHWWDSQGGKVAQLWDIEAYPTLYILDHKGNIAHKQIGFGPNTAKELEEKIEGLVKDAENDKTKN